MLCVNEIDVKYGDLQALRCVSLYIKQKEIVSLVGANGSGKSTLLKAISNILPISRGSVEFLGQRTDQLPTYLLPRMGVVHILEERGIFTEMTVSENLDVAASSVKNKEERFKSKNWVLNLFPILLNRQAQQAGTLSGGEQQMLAISRGLILRPRLLLIDEPSLGLAPLVIKDIFSIFKQIAAQGISILLVEQNIRQALLMSDRGYVLEKGTVTLEGTGKELLDNPLVKKAFLGR